MPYHVLMLAYRKPTLSPKEFYHHYETFHIPLIKSLAGANFPLSHTRRYIQRSGAEEQDGEFPALLLSGSQQDFDYDVMIELSFEDEEAFYRFGRTMGEPDVQAAVAEIVASLWTRIGRRLLYSAAFKVRRRVLARTVKI